MYVPMASLLLTNVEIHKIICMDEVTAEFINVSYGTLGLGI